MTLIDYSGITVTTAGAHDVSDAEITRVLREVYVGGGYTTAEVAASLFQPREVRERGTLICARLNNTSELIGFVILVAPDSPACRVADGNQGEVHLLGVLPAYRGHGVGRKLIDAIIVEGRRRGYTKLILWTQPTMHAAQRLYAAAGFQYVEDWDNNGRTFKRYEKMLIG